jgi:hypothetical protein
LDGGEFFNGVINIVINAQTVIFGANYTDSTFRQALSGENMDVFIVPADTSPA